MKRVFDLLFSLAGLILLSPILLVISLCIAMFDGLPIFFRQDRVGLNGAIFRLNKFRTMKVREGSDKGAFDAGSTARVTAIGYFLRKTKLDELPQLINVFLGQMSLVGPRPEIKKWVDVYPERWAKVHQVRPGITDPASIIYRSEEDILSTSDDPEMLYRNEILPHKLDLYEEYVENHGFLNDIKILLSTFYVLFSR